MADVEYKPLNIQKPITQFLRELKTVDPELRKQFVKDAKAIGAPVASAIKSNLPTVAPLSGMYEPGRMGWNVGVAANKTTLKFKGTRSRERAVTPLLGVWVMSPLMAMLDMAGRGKGAKTGMSREYDYKGGRRRHRLNGQGAYMLQSLGGRGSRYVYPAGEKAMTGVEQKLNAIIDVVEKRLTRRFE